MKERKYDIIRRVICLAFIICWAIFIAQLDIHIVWVVILSALFAGSINIILILIFDKIVKKNKNKPIIWREWEDNWDE